MGTPGARKDRFPAAVVRELERKNRLLHPGVRTSPTDWTVPLSINISQEDLGAEFTVEAIASAGEAPERQGLTCTELRRMNS